MINYTFAPIPSQEPLAFISLAYSLILVHYVLEFGVASNSVSTSLNHFHLAFFQWKPVIQYVINELTTSEKAIAY